MPETNQRDIELMAELCAGRDHALSLLIARWERPLLAFTYRYTQNQTDAVEVTQETFVRVYQHRDRFRRDARFSTWLFTIAANLCRNRARWRKRHPTTPLDAPAIDRDGSESHDRTDWIADERAQLPSDKLAKEETVRAVRAAIDELPHDLKTALLLFQYEGMSYQEIAAVVGCSTKAVETRLYRARNRLKKTLARHLLDDLPDRTAAIKSPLTKILRRQ